jgi:beta-lactam-binding protein with PASTA domain/tRNA A-37 threonylcarbamoyl transferase component Bud32
MDPTPVDSPAPRVFSQRYEIDHLIARGGMAEVYRARDRLLDRPVALKVLFPELSVDRSFVERFRREAQAAANLSHSNIVPVFDWGEDSGTYFIVMELVDGRPLSAILKTTGPLSADRAADIGAHVANALGYANRHGVVHRDVKPGNILITDEGLVKVTDFGIARAVNTEESLTQTGAVMGTATYFSPEQAEGVGVDARSDIYSLGVVLFEMVTGRPPFLGDTPVAVASKHVRERPPAPRELNPAIPPTFEAVIMKAMAKDPAFRYQTAEDLRADLLRFTEGRSVLAANDPTVVQHTVAATQAIGAVGAPGVDATQAIPRHGSHLVDDQGPEPRRSRTRLYATALVVLLVLLAVVGVLLARQLGYLGGAKTFSLPAVVGEPVSQARSTLQGDGLVVRTRSQGSSSPTGTVLATSPTSGTLVKKGATVTLTVAKRTAPPVAQVTVPPVTNTTETNAEGLLSSSGLKYTVKSVTNNAAAGTVIDASPAPGTSVDANSTVTLVVSSGPGSVSVPNVTGETPTQAVADITNAGLAYGGTTNQASSSIGKGLVIGTTPAVGTSVPLKTQVTVIVSTGSPTVVVQNVVGSSASAATATLQNQGLQVSQTTAPTTTCTGPSSPGAGNVATQSPTGGTSVQTGQTVTISVCPATTTPGSTPPGSTTPGSTPNAGVAFGHGKGSHG